MSHIENAKLDDVKDFFYKHYTPSNAILILSGNISHDKGIELVRKWFEDIEPGKQYARSISQEPPQEEFREKTVKGNAPLPALYLTFRMVDRMHEDYHSYDLLSDVLSNGRSSRLFQRLHKEKQLFTQIDAYISGTFDPGILVIEGRPAQGVSMEEAERAIWHELDLLKQKPIEDKELQKLKNKIESSLVYSEVNILHKAMSLAYFELLGDAEMINKESEAYQKVTKNDIQRFANETFIKTNCCKLIYQA